MTKMAMTKLVEELKHRKVIRVAGVYAVVAWLLIQVANNIVPALLLPAWTNTFFVVLLLIGFPIALVLAWAFEITPTGVQPQSAADASEGNQISVAQPINTKLFYGVLTLVTMAVLLIVAVAVNQMRERQFPSTGGGSDLAVRAHQDPHAPASAVTNASTTNRASLAVLPFADLSPARNQEYFSDGITEEILHALAQVPGLRVPGRTTSFSFKGRSLSVQQVAEELDVAYVLEGSVRLAGERVRITAQLIDAGSDTHLWSETYDRDLADIFAVQEEIARAIVDRLPVQLAGGRRLTTDPDATVDPQAYTLYLQGRHFWIRREIPEAIEYFQQAVKVDPDFARAHAALAESYVLLPVIEGHQPEEAFALVEESAQRALALNENLAAAHAARALMLNYRMRWDEADLAFRKALALNDSDPFTLTWHCIYLATVNAIQEALRQCERARALDPAYAPANASLANVLVHLGRNREAEVLYRLSLRLIPGYGLAYQGLINLAIVEERIADAVALAELSLVAGHQARPHLRAVVAYAFAMAGMEVRAREILTQLLAESSAGKFIDPVDLAFVRLGLQDYEGALAEFTKLLASPMSFMGTLVWNPRTHPAFNPLRGDPRFQAVLAQLYPP